MRDGYDLLLRPLRERAEAVSPGAGAHLDQLEQLLTHGLPGGGSGAGGGEPGAGGAGGAGVLERSDSARGAAGCGTSLAVNKDVTWPWVQAMSNITWAVSQVRAWGELALRFQKHATIVCGGQSGMRLRL